jgi:RNA polymerase sigma-70 factor, ECF subfamily
MDSQVDSLARLLVSFARPGLRAQLLALVDLEAKLAASFERGHRAWPAVEVTREAWVQHLARHLPPQVERGLELVHPDLHFAVALAQRQPAALAQFAELFRPKLLAQLCRDNARALAEDTLAAVEERLLVGGEGGPRIAQYSGRGALERFVRAVAANELLNRVRGVQPEPLTDAMVDSFADQARNPELAAVSRDTRRAFAQALHAAVQGLESRERLVLRLHAVEGATIDELGRMFGVHKVTAFRWLEEARLHLRKATHRRLRDTHALGEVDIESLLGGNLATFDLSLRTLFTTVAPALGVSGG